MSDVGARLGLEQGLATADLVEYIRDRRWFAATANEIADIDLVDAVSLPGDAERWLVLLAVRYEHGTHETYQLVLGTAPSGTDPDPIAHLDGQLLVEASASPELARLLVNAPPTGTDLTGQDGIVELYGIGPRYAAVGDAEVRALGTDQTNTSLVVGESLMVKLYRRVEAGLNPELEMLLFLTEHDFANAPHAAGWYSYLGGQLRATLGIAQRFLPAARDGWMLGLDEVPRACEDYLGRIARLGEIVGTMHAVLASDSNDPTFAPEAPTPETASLIAATIEEQIDETLATLPDNDATAALAARAEELRNAARSLSPGSITNVLIRTHGDLHLGQVLWSDGDWFITDFEGEPDRSLADRRRKTMALRDVAGMLRSFAYLNAALNRAGTPPPAGFETDARTRFLDGYRSAVDGTPLLPSSDAAVDRLLDLFELEKVLYELRYEAAHRPDWIDLPLTGIDELLGRVGQ